MSEANQPPESQTGIDEVRHLSAPIELDTITRLKLARSILDKTCIETGAGFVLIMFVPGTDTVLRAFRGLDTPEECIAAASEVVAMLRPHVDQLTGKAPKPLHNDA